MNVTTKSNLSDELCCPEGFLGDYVTFLNETQEFPCPELNFSAALCLASVVTGRKIQDYRGTRTNLIAVNIAPSGGGKDHPRKMTRKILQESDLEGPEKFFSGTGIVAALVRRPSVLIQMDEMGKHLQAACSPRAQTSINGVVPAIMTLHTSSDSVYCPDGYADEDRSKVINQPHLVIYGSTTPCTFFDALSGGDVASGFVGRMLVFTSPSLQHVFPTPFGMREIPESITSWVQEWVDRPHGEGNLTAENPDPPVIPISPDAEERANKHTWAIAERRVNEDPMKAAIWSRAPEARSKLALLHCLSRRSEVIELRDLNWAIEVVNFLTRRVIVLLRGNVATTPHERNVQRFCRELSGSGGVMSDSEMSRKMRWLSRRDRESIAGDLLASGELTRVIRDSKGRPARGVATGVDVLKGTKWIPLTAEIVERSRQQAV